MPPLEGCAIEKKVERLRTLVNVQECLCTTGRMDILVHIQYPLNEKEVYVYLIVCRYSNILFKVVSLSLSLALSCSSFDYKLSWCCCLQLYSECIPKEEKNKDFLLDAAPFSLFFLFRIPVAVDAADDSVVC